MHSNRIVTIRKRAKRRVIAFAVCASTIAGYGTISLFADDEKLVHTTVTEMNKVPAVRSVGIRMINPVGTLPIKFVEKQGLVLNKQSPPTLSLPTLGLPPASDSTPSQHANDSGLLPPLQVPPSQIPVVLTDSTLDRGDLAAPPRMKEFITHNTNGRVVVKLSNGMLNTDSTAEAPVLDSDLVGVRVVAPAPTANSMRMHSMVFNNAPAKLDLPLADSIGSKPPVGESNEIGVDIEESQIAEAPRSIHSFNGADESSPPVRISVVDSLKIDPTDNNWTETETIKGDRPPQLVKPKHTQITHSVSMAHATDIDLTLEGESRLKVESPHPITTHLGPGVVGIASPTMKNDSRKPRNNRGGNSGGNTAPSFDARWAKSTPVKTIELESQTASAMDLPSSINAVAIQNEDVCCVLYNQRTASVVGNQTGSTLVLIWTDESKESPLVMRVNVSQPWQKPISKPSDARDVRQVIAETFPSSNINVLTNEDGTIEVRGTTDSEASAVRILEIVRKLCLVPVKDKVTVSR